MKARCMWRFNFGGWAKRAEAHYPDQTGQDSVLCPAHRAERLAAVKAMPPAKRQIVHASASLGRYIPVL